MTIIKKHLKYLIESKDGLERLLKEISNAYTLAQIRGRILELDLAIANYKKLMENELKLLNKDGYCYRTMRKDYGYDVMQEIFDILRKKGEK